MPRPARMMQERHRLRRERRINVVLKLIDQHGEVTADEVRAEFQRLGIDTPSIGALQQALTALLHGGHVEGFYVYRRRVEG